MSSTERSDVSAEPSSGPGRPQARGLAGLLAFLRRPGAAPLVILLVIAAFYAPLLGRWFASEDFLLLRFLREEPPWADWAAWWTRPWLGIEVVRFYRPVSTLLLAVEAHLFGGVAWAYNLVHLLVHAGNSLMLFLLARDLGRGEAGESLGAVAAAVLFAIHPLHPNAVSWIASFATPFATCFLLAAFLAHRRSRRLGSRAWQAASLGLFALALGSYEAAIVLPALIALSEHLLPPAGAPENAEPSFWRRHALRVNAWTLAAGLGVLYLLLRRALFGQMVGGYQDFAARLDPAEAARLLGDLGDALAHLLVPIYAAPLPAWAPLAVAVVLLAPLALLVPRRREVAAWVFGWTWAVVALAPFAFAPFVPGNGRYAYLSALGAAFALGRLAALPASAGGPLRRALRRTAALAVLALALGWAWLLVGNARIYREAGETARRVSAALAATPEAARGGTVFVSGYPVFLENALGVPLAQVFHYGLADSVRPPFRDTTLAVYPLPARTRVEWWSVAAARPDAGLYAWDPIAERLRPIPPPAAPPAVLEARLLLGGEIAYRPLPAAAESGGAGRDGAGPAAYRLLLTAPGNPTLVELPAPAGDPARVPLPAAFVSTMDRLYGTGSFGSAGTFWWIEAHDPAGRLLAATPLRRVR